MSQPDPEPGQERPNEAGPAQPWGPETDQRERPSADEVTGKDLLQFAKAILLAIATIYLLSAGALIAVGPAAQAIFDNATQILPPIATLVLGSYFSARHK